MGLPRTIKDLLLFNEGNQYQGDVSSLTLPKLSRKFEEWRGGGMDGAVKIDLGMEAMEMEWSAGGPLRDVIRQFATPLVGGVYLRFAGNYQRDDDAGIDTIEVMVRGRHEEIDFGEAKPGEMSEFKVKTSLAYYKLVWNGRTEIEIDPLNMVLIVNGFDQLGQRRAALGL